MRLLPPVLLAAACLIPEPPKDEEDLFGFDIEDDEDEDDEDDEEEDDEDNDEDDDETSETSDTTDTDTTVPSEPTPAFTIGNYLSGSLAIDDSGIRTFFFDGLEYYSVLILSLTAEGATGSCSVWLNPAFDRFDTASTSTRFFPTVHIDIGASTILEDECGWDDDYMLSQFASFGDGTVEVGLTQARFEEDRPYLDVYFNRSWPLDGSTANITMVGGGVGWAMEPDGTVGGYDLVEPTGGTFLPGLYEF